MKCLLNKDSYKSLPTDSYLLVLKTEKVEKPNCNINLKQISIRLEGVVQMKTLSLYLHFWKVQIQVSNTEH